MGHIFDDSSVIIVLIMKSRFVGKGPNGIEYRLNEITSDSILLSVV